MAFRFQAAVGSLDSNINYIKITISRMSKDQHDDLLRYGQGILLKGFNQGKVDDGLLTAKGFADTAARYQTFKDILYFKNYRNAIFQIVPAGNFQINDELRKFQEKSGSDTNNSNLKILEARAKSEKEQFQLTCKNKMKKQVCFGDYVMFKHVDSDTFLSGTIRPSQKGSNGSFVVEVTKNLSQILIFKVEPFRSYEKNTMPIPFDSPVKLLNTVNNGYLTYEKIGLSDKKKKKTPQQMLQELKRKAIQADESYIIPVKTNSSQSEIYECVTHFDDLSKVSKDPNPMPWQFQLHMCDVVNDSLIQHDIIYFQHTEKNAILSTQGKEIVLKQMKKESSEELPFYQCLWEIEKHKDASENAYILRHLMSGMTLGIIKDSSANPIKAELFDISEGVAEGKLGWVELKLAKKQNADIESNSFINICIDEWCLDRAKDESLNQIEEEEQRKKEDEFISITKLNKLAVNELDYQVKKVKFTTEISKNCFIIKEIEDDLKKQVLFALSFHSTIIKLREALKWGYKISNENIQYKDLMQITIKIKQIKDFLKNCSKQESDLQHIRPIFKRQMICKDLGISQLLFELLFYMRKNLEGKYNKKKNEKNEKNQNIDDDEDENFHYIFERSIYEFEKFTELYNSIYEVCYELIRDNLSFKIYVAKWINFILLDLIRQNEESHLKLIKEVFKNNQFLVKNFVDEEFVKSLAQNMLFQKENFEFVEIKYLSLFRLFCLVGQTINTSSQIAILNKFIKCLKENDLSSLYQITLSKQNDDIFAEAAIDKNKLKKRVFKDYFKICKEEYASAWAYFVQYLHLMADMTKGRNKLVEEYMKSLFTLQIMTELFLNEELKEAQAPIIRIIHNLFIESQFYYPIQKKKRISNFEQLKAQEIEVMRYSKEDGVPWKTQALMRVLDGIINRLKKFGPIQAEPTPSKVLQNQNLYQILSFIWQTLNLGFWQKKQQVKDILQNIKRILKPHQNIALDYNKASIQNKHNLLMMKCKQQCMNIIQLILDYDLDLQVRYICKFFQTFQVPTKKRKLVDDQKLLQQRINNPLAIKFINELPRKNMTLVQPTIIENMIELSKYNNPRLTSSAISIMERVLLKNKKAIQTFCQQIFVSGAERVALMNFIQSQKDKFYIMQDQTLVKIKKIQDQADNYFAIYSEDQANTGIMQDIYTMSEVVKNQSSALDIRGIKSLQGSGMNKKLGKKKLINFTDERTSSNTMKQSVLDAQNIHVKILQFVLNCTQVPEENTESLKLLHLSYKLMVSLIWNYQNIKASLIPYIPYIQHHLKKNVGCIDFLKEMYDNNKAMLFNQVNTTKLVKQICNSINSQPENSFYKSKLLDFFRFLIYCNGKTLKNNQIQILKIMQDDSFKNIILSIDKAMIQTYVATYKADFSKLQKYQNIQALQRLQGSNYIRAIYIQPKMLYLITYFQILTSLIDDRNQVNMGKLKKRFPFDKLVDWLRASETCWPLKRNIRAFLNRLYYFQPQIEIYMKKIIGEELDNIIYDLNKFILIKQKTPIQFEGYFFNDPVRFSYVQSYLYLNLQENLFTLYQLATDPKIQHEMKTILHPIDNKNNKGPVNFLRICQRLGYIKNYFAERKNVYTNSFIKFLLNRFQAVIKEFDDDIYAPGMNLPSDQPRAPMKSQKEVARKGLINKIMRGQIGSFYAQETGDYDLEKPLVYSIPDKINNPKDDKKPNQNKLLKKLREILKREKKQFKTTDEEIDYKLNTLVTAIKLSPEADAFLTRQYNQNLKVYSQNDEIFQFVTTIIDMIAKNPKALPVKEKRFFLNFITGIVQQNNRKELSEPKTLDQWQTEDWIDSKEHIYKVQNQLKSAKLGNLITQLLKQNIEDDIQFADSLLLCGISFLFGGNTNTQNNMIQTIRSDKENRVMKNLDNLICKLGEFIVKNIEETSRKQTNISDVFSITTIDNWDFFDISKKYVYRKNVFEPETTDQQIYSKICIRAYKRAFKFLQLLCENNNIDGKNFIRDQQNEIKNFDFIKVAAKEIRNIFIFLNTQICPVSSFLLDFLLQVTQIPVKANQQALMNLTFFEDVCALQNTFFNKPEMISLRGFDGHQQLLDQIFFTTIQIILSNFEGNNLKTFQALDNKLEPKFLVNILTKKLSQMKLITKQDAIAYIDSLTTCEFSQDMISVLNIIIIFIKLKEKLGENSRVYSMYEKEKNKQKTNNKELYEYLEKCLIEIEIVNQGVQQTAIFPKYPVFNSLTGGLRDSVMNGVTRSSHREKIVSLLGYTSAIKSTIQSSYTLLKEQKISENQMNDAFKISAIMSVVLCVYMMMFYNVIINYGQADFQASRVVGLVRFALSLLQLSMALVYAFYWLKFKNWQHPERKARINDSAPLDELSDDKGENKIIAFIKYKAIQISKKLKLDELIFFVQYTLQGGQTTQPLYWSAEFWRMFLYVAVSFFGAFFYPPLYFIHIMDIFCYIPEIGNIFRAIGLNVTQLLYVSFMGVVFTFVFCTVTFSNYQKNVYSGDQPESELCQSMMDCILQLFVSGAIAETMESFQIVRFVYDTIYGIFFGILFSNIISGIMLDAFTSLRDLTNQLQKDKENYCYICNIDRETIQKRRQNFKEHINGKHFLWNYVFFIYFLDKKSPTDYSGLEYLITTQYNKSDEEMVIDWVPIAVQEQFDCKAKLQEMKTEVDEKASFLQSSTSEINETVKNFKELIA